MRILTLTTLYPNAAAPAHGVFVENRLRAFADRHDAEIRVIAPVPWFPVKAPWAGRYAKYAAAPAREIRRGLQIEHPRYAIPPKIAMTYAAAALERCFYNAARRLLADGWDFDLIDAHYLYPDGVAAVRAARRLGKPVVVTARGTDVNYLPEFPRQRRMILEAITDADAVVCVAAALKDEIIRLGAPAEKIRVLRNGVDLSLFRPLDRDAARRNFGVSGTLIAGVGHLIERKGFHLAIEAMKALPDATLLIAGDGEERGALEKHAASLGLADRVRFVGPVAHDALAELYTAADALVLASSREGWPNVLLEAMACGAPVVATPVWGAGEVVAAPAAGRLARERSADALGEALTALLDDPPAREATRRYAENFSWDETADGLQDLFGAVAQNRRAAEAVRIRPLRLDPAPAPRLIVTVDTEEAFDWRNFDVPDHRVCRAADIDRFQALAAGYGAQPLYFLTYPVIADSEAAAYFRRLAASNAAALGLHLHQWTTPPAEGYRGEYYSYQCNLPGDVHGEKLRSLADAFERVFNARARAHRAGRYGISPGDYAALAAIGVDLDFSPSAGFDFSPRGGPDFSGMRSDPFIVETLERGVQTLERGVQTQQRGVIVTPVCGAWALRGGRIFLPQPASDPGFTGARRRLSRRLAAPTRLTCEGAGFDDLAALTRRLIKDRTPVLTFSLHSTSMTPGANPYAETPRDVAAMLEVCERYFDFFKTELGGDIVSLDDLAALYHAPAPD